MIDVMVDLETLSLEDDAVVLQVGMLAADLREENIFSKLVTGEGLQGWKSNVRIQPQMEEGRRLDEETLRWWLGQSNEAQASLLEGQPEHHHHVFQRVVNFLAEIKQPWMLWSLGSMDIRVLENYYKQGFPWGYRQVNDLRTLRNFFHRVTLELGYEVPQLKGPSHDALVDCRYQMTMLFQYRRFYGEWGD